MVTFLSAFLCIFGLLPSASQKVSLTPKREVSRNVARVVRLLQVSPNSMDLVTRSGRKQALAHFIRFRKFETPVIRSAIGKFIKDPANSKLDFKGGESVTDITIYLLNRSIFEVSPKAPAREAAVLWASDRKNSVRSELWPFEKRKGELQLVDSPIFAARYMLYSEKSSYDPMKDFDYLVRRCKRIY